LFLLVLLIFLIISDYKFDQVFDVMLQSISSPRGEAASPPSPRCSDAKKADTYAALQLQTQSKRYRTTLFFSGGAAHDLRSVLKYLAGFFIHWRDLGEVIHQGSGGHVSTWCGFCWILVFFGLILDDLGGTWI
jgi:hypothetical protein